MRDWWNSELGRTRNLIAEKQSLLSELMARPAAGEGSGSGGGKSLESGGVFQVDGEV